MPRLATNELQQFLRKYRFAKARLLAMKVRATPRGHALILRLRVGTAPRDLSENSRSVRLELRLDGVDEYRFQKRPSGNAIRVADLNIGLFGGVIYLNLEAMVMNPGDVPGVHDYRLSDAYAAGQTLSYDELPPRKAT